MNAPHHPVTAAYYDQVRNQIEHEDDLLTQRVSWLMASQSFLFSAYAIVLNGLQFGEKTRAEAVKLDFYHFLPVAGILSTSLIYASIWGGVLAIHRLRKLWDSHQVQALSLDRPPIHSSPVSFLLGQCAPRLLPLVLIGMWIYLWQRGWEGSGFGH